MFVCLVTVTKLLYLVSNWAVTLTYRTHILCIYAESNGKLQNLFIPGKTAALVPEFAVEDLPSAELQPWFLCLHGRTLWAEPPDGGDIYIYFFFTTPHHIVASPNFKPTVRHW